ncbi:uncharacterized protein LOC106652688 [Trichogramma pretiosum]|uniref:uncharacterized protein LOC106652688 n=1 Tax=Trichogramma pretiosum TaxID=7493 RepID=UPI0006C987D2|nr:uncharacterized protein LOC106652688 [Trichogramma pretiosum]
MSGKKYIPVARPLNDAVESGNLESLKALLQSGADPNEIDEEGMAPLNLICNQLQLTDIHLTMMQQLINYKADVNINKNFERNSPVIQLFRDKRSAKLRYEALKLLLENNADAMQTDSWGDRLLDIILYQTKSTNTVKLLKLLMTHGVDVNIPHSTGYYPLTLAFYFPTIEVAEFLLKNGADPNRYNNRDDPGTFLTRIFSKYPLTFSDYEKIQLLIQYKADVNLKIPIVALFRCKSFRNDADTLLRKIVLKLLLENNADVSATCEYHGTIPTTILGMNSKDSIEIIKLLLKYGMDVNLKDNWGRTPLHIAVKRARLEEIEFLLLHGADPNIVDDYGNTPLNEVCVNHHITNEYLQVIQYLLRYKVDMNIQNNKGNTPIISLFYKRSEYQLCYEVLKLLLENNANISHLNNEGKTVLHVIIQSTKAPNFFNEYKSSIAEIYQCMEFIIQRGLDINVQDRDGLSLLNEAVSYCNLDLVKFLLNHGSQVSTAQFQGGYFQSQNAILTDLMMTQNILAIIDILENKGFEMTNDHFLSVFKFLIGYYVPIQSSALRKALETGFTLDISNYIKSKQTHKYELDTIFNYMYLAEYGMIYKDEKTYENLLSILKSLDSKNYLYDDILKTKDIKKYIKKAKKVMVGKKTTLLQIFTSSPDETYLLLKNCDYQSVINSEQFEETFKGISSILKGHINKSLVREFAKKVSLNPLKQLTQGLPYVCCEYIIEYLNNNELCCMYESLYVR